MKYLFKRFPGRHAVLVLTAVIIVGAMGATDLLLMADFVYVDFFWIIPIAFAAILLTPLETAVVALASSLLCLVSFGEQQGQINFVPPVLIGSGGILAGLLAAFVKRNINRLESVRDAVESSPLAYAEFSFPGYVLTNFNKAFASLSNISVAPGEKCFLHDCFQEGTANEITKHMDDALMTPGDTECKEFHITTPEGNDTFW